MGAGNTGILAIILAGGEGKRLRPLTEKKPKALMPVAGMYKLIDFSISNCINSGFKNIIVLGNYLLKELRYYTDKKWIRDACKGSLISVLPASDFSPLECSCGSANAVASIIALIEKANYSSIIILGCDHVYRMDYSKMLYFHYKKESEVTIAVTLVPKARAKEFDILEVNPNRRVAWLEDKQVSPHFSLYNRSYCLASMGVYIFEKETLVRILKEDGESGSSSHDISRDIIPRLIYSHRVYSYYFPRQYAGFRGYWQHIATLDAFYKVNVLSLNPRFLAALNDPLWPLTPKGFAADIGKPLLSQPHYYKRINSIISRNCLLGGSEFADVILSPGVRVGNNSKISSSIILNNASIGNNVNIRNAIVCEDSSVPDNTRFGYDLKREKEVYLVTPDGIVVS